MCVSPQFLVSIGHLLVCDLFVFLFVIRSLLLGAYRKYGGDGELQ